MNDRARTSSSVGGTPDKRAALQVFAPADWQSENRPIQGWIVSDWIPTRAVTLLSGDGGTGKSLVALQLAAAVVTGRRWLGLPTKVGSALVLACEDDRDELHRRLLDIGSSQGFRLDELEALRIVSGVGEDAALFEANEGDSRGRLTDRMEQIRELGRDVGPALIVLDTAADLYAANENNRRLVRQFIAGLAGLAHELDAAILLLAHPSKAAGAQYSGSTAWNASVRSRLLLARPNSDPNLDVDVDPTARILSIEKANYSASGAAIRLRWEAGSFVALDEPGRLDRVARQADADRALIDGLKELARQNREPSASRDSRTFGPNEIAKLPGQSATKGELIKALERALVAGTVVVVDSDGPPSRRRKVLRVADSGLDPSQPC